MMFEIGDNVVVSSAEMPVVQCVDFLEKLHKVRGFNGRIVRVRVKNKNTTFETFRSMFDEFSLRRLVCTNGEYEGKSQYYIKVDWFARYNTISPLNIEEIWLGDIPLYYFGKERFWCISNNKQVPIMFHEEYNGEKVHEFGDCIRFKNGVSDIGKLSEMAIELITHMSEQ